MSDGSHHFKRARTETFVINGSNNIVFLGSSNNKCDPQMLVHPSGVAGTKRDRDESCYQSDAIVKDDSEHTHASSNCVTLAPIPISSTSIDDYSQYDDI